MRIQTGTGQAGLSPLPQIHTWGRTARPPGPPPVGLNGQKTSRVWIYSVAPNGQRLSLVAPKPDTRMEAVGDEITRDRDRRSHPVPLARPAFTVDRQTKCTWGHR